MAFERLTGQLGVQPGLLLQAILQARAQKNQRLNDLLQSGQTIGQGFINYSGMKMGERQQTAQNALAERGLGLQERSVAVQEGQMVQQGAQAVQAEAAGLRQEKATAAQRDIENARAADDSKREWARYGLDVDRLELAQQEAERRGENDKAQAIGQLLQGASLLFEQVASIPGRWAGAAKTRAETEQIGLENRNLRAIGMKEAPKPATGAVQFPGQGVVDKAVSVLNAVRGAEGTAIAALTSDPNWLAAIKGLPPEKQAALQQTRLESIGADKAFWQNIIADPEIRNATTETEAYQVLSRKMEAWLRGSGGQAAQPAQGLSPETEQLFRESGLTPR